MANGFFFLSFQLIISVIEPSYSQQFSRSKRVFHARDSVHIWDGMLLWNTNNEWRTTRFFCTRFLIVSFTLGWRNVHGCQSGSPAISLYFGIGQVVCEIVAPQNISKKWIMSQKLQEYRVYFNFWNLKTNISESNIPTQWRPFITVRIILAHCNLPASKDSRCQDRMAFAYRQQVLSVSHLAELGVMA